MACAGAVWETVGSAAMQNSATARRCSAWVASWRMRQRLWGKRSSQGLGTSVRSPFVLSALSRSSLKVIRDGRCYLLISTER
jgi:hypothetical protein